MEKTYYIYIMTNHSRTLYTGMTNHLKRRVFQHKQKQADSFTRRYNMTRLVWFGKFRTPLGAIRMEKRIKGWLRQKKIELIETDNPEWKDLSEGWFTPVDVQIER